LSSPFSELLNYNQPMVNQLTLLLSFSKIIKNITKWFVKLKLNLRSGQLIWKICFKNSENLEHFLSTRG